MAAARRCGRFGLREEARCKLGRSNIPDMPEARRAHLRAQRGGVEIALETLSNRGYPFDKRLLRGAAGFRHVDDIGPAAIAARFFPESEQSAPARGGHVMHASTF